MNTTRAKLVIIGILITVALFSFSRFNKKANQVTYQTAISEKGTLIVSVSSSGQVSSTNNASITTQASGVISKLYVINGQYVESGAPIADIDLDLEGKQRSSQSLAGYQSAKNSLESAKANLYSTQSDMFTNWKSFMETAQSGTYQNGDGSPNYTNRALADFHISEDDWLATEARYKNQQNVITQAQTSANSSWWSYLQSSPTIYSPISGTITGLSLQEGSVLTAQSNSSGTSASQKIGSITTNALPLISINLTEIDIPKVKIGNKATVTFDAFPDKTYTGTVVSIDTVGSINSGVTNYPTLIKLDTDVTDIFPNMSVQASIITQTKDDVLLVPTAGVQTQNGQSLVRILRNGKPEEVAVETGISSDSQIEIVSGLNEGETVITGTTQTSGTSSQTQSPFSGRGFGGGAIIRR